MLLKVITVLCLLQAEASSINMMESLSEEGSCSKYDSRGVLWTGEYGMYTKKSCSLTLGPFYAGSSVEIEKEAFWFCDETLGDFDSPEPDRSGCTDPWIDNLNDNMLSSLSTGEISRIISDGFLLESPAFGVPEDSLWKLGDFLPVLLEEDITIEEEQADITTDTPTDATTAATTTTTNNYTITINPTDAPTAPQTTTSTTTTTIWPNRTTTIKPATTTVKPTTTTIKPTTSTTTTTTTTAAAGICSEIDSRNKIWHATYDEFAYQNCDFCADPCENQASWFCDRTLGRFNTPEPDRSNCIDPWIANIDEMFNILTAFDISETIHNGLKELTSTPPLGGTILKFEELLPKVLELRRTESNSYNDNDDFTINLVSSINEIFNQSVGWTEISDLKNKSKTVTDYLEALDYTGYLYAIKNNCSNCSSKKEFKFSNIHLTSRTVEFNITESAKECFYFDSDPICITSKKEEEKDDDYDCDVLVATMVRTTNDQEIFPNTLTGMMINERKFGKKLIGITINNKTSKWKNDVTIIFDHQTHSNQATCLFVPRTPTCVFWNITTSSWSTLGCKFDYVSSTLDKAVCVCDHCANFGAMLDWEGNAPANDPTLSKLSISLLSLSCFFLVLTEIILMMQLQRTVERNPSNLTKTFKRIRAIERNRNICLFIAQMLLIILPDLYKDVDCTVCEAFGGVLHFIWLTVFAWTVIGGISLYIALVRVFFSEKFLMMKFYFVGYGLPSIIVILTVALGQLTGSLPYLMRNYENHVNSCLLHGSAIFALVVPLGFVLVFNFVVIIIVLKTIYKVLRIRISKPSGGIFDAKPETKLLFYTMVKNTFRLFFLLGLPWFFGLFGLDLLPTSTLLLPIPAKYATVILNSCPGFYIFFFSIVEDPKVMPEGKKKCRAMITMFWNRLRVLAELCRAMFTIFWNRLRVLAKLCRDMFALFWNRFQVQAELRDLLLSCCTRYEHYKLWDYLYLTSLENLLRRILRSPRKIEQSHQSQKSKPLSQEFEPSSEQDEVYSLETKFSTEGLSSYC